MSAPAPIWSLGLVTVTNPSGDDMVPATDQGYVTIGENEDGDPETEIRVEGKDAPAIAKRIAALPELVAALYCFIADERFQVAVGGNPNVVERMLADAREAYAKATSP